jgi:hypothetical protein
LWKIRDLGIAPGQIISKEETEMATPSPAFREVQVRIGLDATGNIVVDPNYFEVSKRGNEEVRWVCNQDHRCDELEPCFTVDFEKNGSPFYESQFSSLSPVSGLARRSVLPGPKIYEYTVRVGLKSLDPGGGVKG